MNVVSRAVRNTMCLAMIVFASQAYAQSTKTSPAAAAQSAIGASHSSIFDNLTIFAGLDGSKQPQDLGINAIDANGAFPDWDSMLNTIEPQDRAGLVTLLAERVLAQSDVLTDLTSLDLTARLAKFLLAESDRLASTEFELVLNQTELGQVVGGSRQSVNQALRSLEASGLIESSPRRARILDVLGLRMRSLSSG